MSFTNPEWKWEYITINFLFKLPRTPNGCNRIWIIVDGFTKTTSFIPIKQSLPLDKLAKLYVDKIVSQYGTLVSTVWDQDPQFTSKFWPKLQDTLDTKLHFSTTFQPRISVIRKALQNARLLRRSWRKKIIRIRVSLGDEGGHQSN